MSSNSDRNQIGQESEKWLRIKREQDYVNGRPAGSADGSGSEYCPEPKRRDCFIATAVYGDIMAPEVISLRKFRDNVLRKYWVGLQFISMYYKISPPIADWIKTKPVISHVVKKILSYFVSKIT